MVHVLIHSGLWLLFSGLVFPVGRFPAGTETVVMLEAMPCEVALHVCSFPGLLD